MSITVVSTAFKTGRFAADCIRSVRYQTVEPKHIYIDASRDDETDY